MNKLYKELLDRKKDLELKKTIIQKNLSRAPQGTLRISKSKKATQYYYISDPQDTNGKYIPKNKCSFAIALAEANYYSKLLFYIDNELVQLNNFLEKYAPNRLEDIFSCMHSSRKALLKPIFCSDKDYVAYWQTIPYTENSYNSQEKIYCTNKGDLVRSKSESLIADIIFSLGIPYKYESPILLPNGKRRYPDFTLLKVSTRQEFYYEHLGLLDDINYLNYNLKKFNEYQEVGIFLGKNLLISYETTEVPLNTIQIRQMLENIICN